MKGSPRRADFWAKLTHEDDERRGPVVAWHSLLGHSADVAAVVEALLSRTILGRRLARLAGWDDLADVHVARLAVLAALHDAGKANHSFQDQAFPGAGRSKGHVKPMLNVLKASRGWQEKLLLPLGLGPVMDWFAGKRDPNHILHATWAHHGEPRENARENYAPLWDANAHRDPVGTLRQLGEAAARWFPDAYGSAPRFPAKTTAFQHAFNGVLTLADWIGSSFPYRADDESDDDITRARRLAHERLANQGLFATFAYQELLPAPTGFGGILGAKQTPFDAQAKTLDRPVSAEGGLTVLESDTGSGKTEAALARFFRLYEAGEVDGLYFAVPTRTAAKQLYNRVEQAVKRVFDGHGAPPPVVQAVPGYLKADGVEGTPIERYEVRWHDAVEEDATRERRWAAESPKRYLAGAVVVGTIDQVLLSTLQVKHAHMRAGALLRHFLVVDEVHASDVYMTCLLQAVLAHHLGAGGHALLMSATLGTDARLRLTTTGHRTSDTPALAEAETSGYPLVTHVAADRLQPETTQAEPSGYTKAIQMEPKPWAADQQRIARAAVAAARQGARVLVLRNLVDDCVAVQEAIEDELGPDETGLLLSVGGVAAPHHSRFAGSDRQRLDRAIENAFGKETPIRGIVAVATQTVQISLDISASILFTDLCPVDVLLQRLGRLHRHGRTGHPVGFDAPRCVVLTPAERDLSGAIVRTPGEHEGQGLKGPHGLGTVYSDLRVLEATWRLLEESAGEVTWTIPDDNRRLVERGTHPEQLAAIVGADAQAGGEAWAVHERWVHGEYAAMTTTARHVLVQRDRGFGSQGFGGDEVERIRTRLGQDDVRVPFAAPQPSPFGASGPPRINALDVPAHLLRRKGDGPLDLTKELEPEAAETLPEGGGFTFTVAGRRFRYDRLGLARTRGEAIGGNFI